MSHLRPDQMSDEELRRDVRATRKEVAADVDALGRKITPENLKSEAKEAARGAKDEAINRTKVRARDTATRVQSRVRSNPWPFAMIAGGIGWMLVDRYSDGETISAAKQRASEAMAGAGGRVSHARDEVSLAGKEASGRFRGRFEDAKKQASLKATDAQLAARDARERSGIIAKDAAARTEGFYMDNPLLVGGIALAAGVGLGLLLPATRREIELAGAQSDALQQQALELGRTLRHDAEAIARASAEEAKATAKSAMDETKATAKSAVDETKATAKSAVDETTASAKKAARSHSGNGGPPASSPWR